MRGWTDAERRANARECMAGDIDRDPVGRQLTPEARSRAIEAAADAWQGRTTAGEAVQTGIRSVTAGILKDK
jgi:hypothetical protein